MRSSSNVSSVRQRPFAYYRGSYDQSKTKSDDIMRRMKHSPAPWRIVRSSDYTGDPADTTIQSIEAADGRSVYYTESGYFKPSEYDVKIIAAAPTMAALLERAAESLQDYCSGMNGDYNDALASEINALLKTLE